MLDPDDTGFVIGNRGVGLDGVGLLLTLTIVARLKKILGLGRPFWPGLDFVIFLRMGWSAPCVDEPLPTDAQLAKACNTGTRAPGLPSGDQR